MNYAKPQCLSGYELKDDGLCYPNTHQPPAVAVHDPCPSGYVLKDDGLCYPKNLKDCPTTAATTTAPPLQPAPIGIQRCPSGYVLGADGLCYPKILQDCPTTAITTTAPPLQPIPKEIQRCPSGSVFINKQCRKIVCSMGEYYRGRCMQAACEPGLVWYGNKCQKPGYTTTILEIENVFVNNLHKAPVTLTRTNKNKIIKQASTTEMPYKPLPTVSPRKSVFTEDLATVRTPAKPTNIINSSTKCCTIVSPRICKLYNNRWICAHRRIKSCDPEVCTTNFIYLKAPDIKYEDPILVMPPNPSFNNCENDKCIRPVRGKSIFIKTIINIRLLSNKVC